MKDLRATIPYGVVFLTGIGVRVVVASHWPGPCGSFLKHFFNRGSILIVKKASLLVHY